MEQGDRVPGKLVLAGAGAAVGFTGTLVCVYNTFEGPVIKRA